MKKRLAWVGVVVCLAVWGTAAAAVTLDDFAAILASIPVQNQSRILAAINSGLKSSCCGFPTDQTYRLFERLASVSGAPADKEAIILVIATAIEQGIPVDTLLNKAFEGLARGFPLSSLASLLSVRLSILEQTRDDCFFYHGIFRASPGVAIAAGASALPAARFDALLSEVGDTLADYVENGGSPFNGQEMLNQVQARLNQLRGTALVGEDIDLLLSRIGPTDLTKVVSEALT